jgi:anti-anti-sigma factor
MRAALRAWLRGVEVSEDEIANVLIAVGEACANGIEHGTRAADDSVDIRAQIVDNQLVLGVRDHGTWLPIRTTTDRGHGLRMMRLLMDDIDVGITEHGTHVELRLGLEGRKAPLGATEGSGAGIAVAADSGAPPAEAPGTVVIDRVDDVPVARLFGEIDLARIPELRAALAGAVVPGDRGIVVDLLGVSYMDSAGLHMLHGLAHALVARGQAMRVVAGDAPVARMLELIGMQRTMAVDLTVAEAAAALAAPRPGF